MKRKNHKQKIIYGILSFIIPFIVYVLTLAPTVTFIDSGELAAVATKLGVAHPTGYPLFTILGNVFTKIPIGDEIYRLNLMSAVVSSAALFMFFNLMVFIFKDLNLSGDPKNEFKNLPDTVIYNISLASVLVLAFSRTFWDTANAIEVYSLHTFFLVTNIYLFLKANSYNPRYRDSVFDREKYWILFAFVLGLSFTNHLSTIFLSVGFLYLYFAVNGINKISFKRILILLIPFLLGYSVYIYLFVRAENNVLSWGYPHNFENFWRHFTAKEFSRRMFSSSESSGNQLSHFITSFPREYFYIPLLFAIPGLFKLYSFSKQFFFFTLLLFIFCVIYAINYDIIDIDPYFLLAFIVSAIWIAFGLIFMIRKFKRNSRQVSFLILLVCFFPLIFNFKEVDKSKSYFVKDFTMNVYKSAPENSIIISKLWDFLVAPSLYFQNVKNIRPDLIIIEKELLKKSWYVNHLMKHYPGLYETSKTEFDSYLNEVIKYEKNRTAYINPTTGLEKQELRKFNSSLQSLLVSIIEKNYPGRNIYTTAEIEQDEPGLYGKTFSQIPQGILIKFSKDKTLSENIDIQYDFDITNREDYHHQYLMVAYYNSYLSRANYLLDFSKFDEAENLINKAFQIDPNSPEAKQLLIKLNQLKSSATKTP